MGRIIEYTARLMRAGRRTYARKWSFLGFFAVVFLCSVTFLGQLGLLPDAAPDPVVSAGSRIAKPLSAASVPVSVPESALRVDISKINISVTVASPTTTDIAVLNVALLSGAVHYPTSAKLGEDGNVVLFGHSSYLPIVKNQAYKAFNGIQKLATGDVVIVSSGTTAYTYAVRSVAKESASDNSTIPLSVDGKVLTLVTCNSFATKQDRFVVVADFVESHPVSR